jgi:hypothetical protein
MSAEKSERPCFCCAGTSQVEDIDGHLRPCSRCSFDRFHAWADSRRPAVQPLKNSQPQKG